MEALQDDTGDGSMQCTEHPFKNNTPAGGICPLCLQEKLGKLVSSSFPIAVFPSSSPSSPRSDTTTNTTTVSSTIQQPPLLTTNSTSLLPSHPQNNPTNNTSTNCHHRQYNSNRSRILYLLSHKKKKKKDHNIIINGAGAGDRSKNLVFKRSKSTAATNRRGGDGLHYMDADGGGFNSPHKRGFWSFMHLQKHSHSSSSVAKTHRGISSNSLCASSGNTFPQRSRNEREIIVVEENESPNSHPSFDRKVSRSRSVGCGSRSFSGDFFERISTGFGDCTLRRAESHREGKTKVAGIRNSGQDCIKERVRCGGLFSGFMITSSSSSSSSSSYLVASNVKENTGKVTSTVTGTEQHSRSKSWGWALASPMRAFSKPASSSSKREGSNKNQSPNLSAIPSLLSVRS